MDVNSNERRRQTRSNVYHYLYGAQEFCTRQSLAQALDLSLPTIYQNLTDLVDAGLVRYAGQSQSTGGRKASGLAIVPDARVAVGIALTEDRLRFSAADLRLNEIAYHKVSHTSNFEMEELGTLVARELEQFLDTYHIDRSRLLGVCIAMAGVTDPEGGHLLYAPTMHLRNVELSGLTRSIPYPTYVENDATCSGYAEWLCGETRRIWPTSPWKTAWAARSSPTESSMAGTTGAAPSSATCAWSPADCPAPAASGAAWRPTAPTGGFGTPSASL